MPDLFRFLVKYLGFFQVLNKLMTWMFYLWNPTVKAPNLTKFLALLDRPTNPEIEDRTSQVY